MAWSQLAKNVVIEDEGFSMRDISDFAGILPETIGSIGGAIAGGGLTFGLGFYRRGRRWCSSRASS